jgi:hypothetical protein
VPNETKPRRRGFSDPEVARRASRAAHSIDTYVARVVARAGELKPEHVEKLRALLPPVRPEPDDSRPEVDR